jgi:SAM-dependent methyltransferase
MYTEIKNCKLCKSSSLKLALDLADLPIGDKYLPENRKNESLKIYPLKIMMCENCGNYQNSGFVDPKIIYNFYLSRPATTNPHLSGAYKEYADILVKNYSNNKKDLKAYEAGSNDGTFIEYMQKSLDMKVLGIEPSPNLSKQANDRSVETINDYFNSKLATKIVKKHGQTDFFITNHTASNIVDFNDFIDGVKIILKDDGVFSLQTFYHKDVIEHNLIENFTHEHLNYFYIKPLQSFLKNKGMEIFDIQLVPAKGGSFRAFIQKSNGPNRMQEIVSKIEKDEEDFGMNSIEIHERIKSFISDIKGKLHQIIDQKNKEDKKIAAYGTSIGGTTFIFNYGISKALNFMVDDDPYRQGLLSPHFHIPVVSKEEIFKQKIDTIIILAPLYFDQIVKKNNEFLEQGGTFIKIWPNFEIVKN